jgi:phytoene synthase
LRESSQLIDLRRQAAEATAAGSKSFYFATRFFPPDLAQAAHAVYWFCRTTDDIVDENKGDIHAWETALRDALTRGHSTDPVLDLFARAAIEYRIPHEYPLDLVEGVKMDARGQSYQTFDELRLFCYRVASTVGLMMMHVIGSKPGAGPFAIDLGIAMQLTNILRDVGTDLRMGRIYLPSEELARFGYSQADLRAGVRNDAFTRLMEFHTARARSFYKAAEPGIAMLDARGRFAVRIAADVYAGILDRIEAGGYDVFDRRAVVPKSRKYWITARAMALPALRQLLPFTR